MSKNNEADRTYSSIDNPTAAYPREQMAALFDSEETDPDPVPPPAPRERSISWIYLGLALVGGGLLAVGVSGLVALVLYAGS